jgi:hypothetical protein
MRTKTLPSIVLSFLLLGSGSATAGKPVPGSVQIERKTEIVVDSMGGKAEVSYPAFSGLPTDILARIQVNAGLKGGTGSSLEEWRKEEDTWLSGIDYKVHYNQDGLLSLTYSVDGMGAYPSTSTTDVVVDLRTGLPVTAPDLFRKASLVELAAKVDRLRAAAVEESFRSSLESIKTDPDPMDPLTEEDLNRILEEPRKKHIQASDLDRFRLGEEGVTFVYDFDFPHVIQALEPSGEYFLSYKDLQPYINPEGPLGAARLKRAR